MEYMAEAMEYANSRDFVKAIEYFDKALDLCSEGEDDFVISSSWGLKACAFHDGGAPPVIAIECCKKGILAYPTYEKNYEILGHLYIEIDEPEKAMKYLNQAKLLSY